MPANLKTHGVAFAEALTVFADPLARIFDDPDHSENERRELIVGHSAQQRLLGMRAWIWDDSVRRRG